MDDTAKYLIHATITADGVVERSDVVGAVFGQTEGLLGDDLDLRDLQQSSKVGRIDVQIESENGQSFGELTVASSLDRVETSLLAASLETISRIGPCRAAVEVTDIEDVRAAKRREIVERAKELLADAFDESVMTSEEILEEVREAVRVEDIAEYRGLPAGPRVADSDAIIVVEGRADVLRLLRYGVKNAIAVEGTNVPDAVAELSRERTVTAFLDGDRGGELILRELAQVGTVDYVAFAPSGRSVEDLARQQVLSALREKVRYESLADREGDAAEAAGAVAATDGSARPAPADTARPRTEAPETTESPAISEGSGESATADAAETADAEPTTLRGHVEAVVGGATGRTRLLDGEFATAADDVAAGEAFDAVEGAEETPHAVVVDGELDQRLLDVAAQRGVEHVVARSTGEFVKQPVTPRVRTADQLLPNGGADADV